MKKFSRLFTKSNFALEEKQKIYQKGRDVIQWVGVFLSISALSFQLTILYPWHPVVEEEIVNLQKKVKTSQEKVQQDKNKIEILNRKN